MPELIVELDRIPLTPDIVEAFADELKAGGLVAGMFFIGAITKVPDMLYLLWHISAEVPVSAMIAREDFANHDRARAAAQDFLLKWNQRIG